MESTKLTGIERELVLQYLIDGNVPVTVTPIEGESDNSDNADNADGAADSSDKDKVRPATSALFPIAIKAEQLKVLEQGIILLTNPPQNVLSFIDKKIRVEFYFNRLGLFFETKIKAIKAGLALVIPSSISRIQEDDEPPRQSEFSARLFYSVNSKSDMHIDCFPAAGYNIFSRPVWKDIAEESQKKAKAYLEEFIVHARKKGVAGSGVQLIPVVRYLAEQRVKMQSVQGRQSPLDVLFINHERIVLAAKSDAIDLREGAEYAAELLFPIRQPVAERKIFATCRVESNYSDDEDAFTCAVCRFTSLQEEDVRFLYEKCVGEKFI